MLAIWLIVHFCDDARMLGWRLPLASGVLALGLLPTSAAADFALNAPMTGTMPGQTGGTVLNFPLVGSGDTVSVALRYDGANPGTDSGVGFIVFHDTNIILNQPASNDTGYGAVGLAFATINGLNYDVQAYNYLPNFNATYHLLISDPSQGPTPRPLPRGDAGALQRDHSSRQILAGGGATHNYQFVGDGTPLTLVLDARPRDPVNDNGIGLAVYDTYGNGIQNITFRHALSPTGAIVWSFITTAGLVDTVQAYNYEPRPITYVVAAL